MLGCSATALGQGSGPQPDLPSDPRHRIGVATYPFRAVLDAPGNPDRVASKPGMDLATFARYVRSTFGVFGIEPLHSHFTSTAPAAIASLRRSFDAVGVRTVNIPVDAPTDLCSTDASVRAQGYATYQQWIDIARQLGSPSIRIGSVPRCADVQNVAAIGAALRPVVAYGASRGVMVTLENDDPVLANATRLTGVLRAVSSPWLRGLPDFANGLLGGDERFNALSVGQMFAFATSIAHVKDGETIRGKDVHVSLPELFTIARQAGYRGFYSMESDDGTDPERSTGRLIQQSLALM